MKNRLHTICFSFTALLYSLVAASQTALPDSLNIDSLKKILQVQQEDTNKVNTLNALSAVNVSNRDIALSYAKSALSLAQKLNDKSGEGNADYNYAVAFKGRNYSGTQGSLGEVLTYLNRALNIFQLLKNESRIAECYSMISIGYVQIDQNIPDGIRNMLLALNIYEKTGDKRNLAACYMALGSDYLNEGDESSAKEGLGYLKIALNLSKEVRDSAKAAYTAHLIGEAAIYKNDYNAALQYLNASLGIYEAMGSRAPDFGISWTKGSIGDLYVAEANEAMAAHNNKLAIGKLETALAIFRERVEAETTRNNSHRQSYGELGDCYFSLSKISPGKKKREYLLQSLKYNELLLQIALDARNKAIIGNAYYNLSEVDDALGNYKDAFGYYKWFITYRDSLYNEENTKKTVQAKMQYEFDKKTAIASAEQDKRNAEARREKALQYFVIAGLGFILLAVLTISLIQFRNNKQKKRANEVLQQQKEKVESTLLELQSTQAQLIQSEKMASLGELTAGIAHEIQNPLNFVNNFSEVNKELIEELRAEKSKNVNDRSKEVEEELLNDIEQNLEKIIQHGRRADAIVKGMLLHSRMGSGQKELVDINTLAEEYLRLSYHGLRAKNKNFNAKFETHFDPSLEKISVVPADLGRVLLNLVNNAFYAVNEKQKNSDPDYQPLVRISTKKTGKQLEIMVWDNGNGIPSNFLEKIFHPFFTSKPTGEGTGLGLSLSYDIVKGHGGEIRVETREKEFTRFTVLLPL